MWADHYCSLFNSVPFNGLPERVLLHLNSSLSQNLENASQCFFNPSEVAEIISDLQKGKAAGPDGLSPEHLLYSSNHLSVLSCFGFNVFLVHVYLPLAIINSVLVPVIKDKAGDASDKSNYRPIALTSALSMVHEKAILSKFNDYFLVSDHQFMYIYF